ncbi:MAG: hypothetical protein PHG67_11860 [Bacteroidales bacterium]|jgi:hypothetical protein|nr:hypothetical protein [Bacteroidales bacterium]HOI32136.1 hypothetical protein [Bacteroidales bacterium]
MKQKIIQEYIGSLTKEETLRSLESDLLIKDSCVLESVNPFFGYYADAPNIQKPQYLYFILDEPVDFMELQRIILEVNKKSKLTVDAVWASITVPSNQKMHALRVRNLPQYNQISILQQHYREAGLPLKKHNKGMLLDHALIHLEKFFYLEEQGNGLFFDAYQAYHGYFIIPEFIGWTEFKRLTAEAKYDISILNFDAARASVFKGNDILELVRIYREDIDLDKLRSIRERYYHLLNLK